MLKFLKKRNFRYGAASTIFTVVFIAIVIVINLLVTLLTERFPINIDITAEGLYDLTDETESYVKNLDRDVTITILVPEAQFVTEIIHIIKNYEKLSSHVTFRAIDGNLNPQYMQQFADDSTVSVSTNSIIIESGDRYKVLSIYDLFQISSDNTYITGLRAEQKLTSAIMFVTSETLPIMYFTQGHEESVPSGFRNACAENNIEVRDITLLMEEFDENAAFVVICSPSKDFTEDEINKIDKMVDKGGFNIIYFTSPAIRPLENLESYFAEWGIQVEQDLVLDPSQSWLSWDNVLPNYGTSSALESFTATNAIPVVPVTSSLTLLFSQKSYYTTGALLNSSATSYAKAGDLENLGDNIEKADDDAAGPLTIAATSEKSLVVDNAVKNSRLAVFGSSNIAADSLLENSAIANHEVLMTTVAWMRGQKDMITILPKYFTDSSMTISTEQSRFIMILLVIVLPVIILGVGIFIWLRRKRA